MAEVVAVKDIITEAGFVVALKGDKGKALCTLKPPTESKNDGRIPIKWSGRQRVYWVPVDSIQPLSDGAAGPIDLNFYVVRIKHNDR